MKIHAIIHAPFEGLGVIQEWSDERGHQVNTTHIYRDEILPCTGEFDLLISMGGPQSVNELECYPYFKDEMELVHRAIEKDKYVLGICLGAQLIARVLGAKVAQGSEKEIGVFPVRLTEAGQKDRIFQNFPEIFKVMHWHGEMFDIPGGCESLMSSEGCSHQAFAYNDKVYGLQFHLEQTIDNVEAMIASCPNDLAPGKFVQSVDDMRKEDYSTLNEQARLFLNTLIETGV